ncbi:MAG: GerAB/ArcD/ProY family transporter [Ruminiclostridium sp.]|nr:GerAB/ArcD/ProY family transporter [Ruminiclostridium sp.]
MRNKTGGAELAAALAVSRVFAEAASLPDEYHTYGMQRFTVIVLSFALTAALCVPVYLAVKSSGGGIFAGGDRRGGILRSFLGALFSVYLLYGAAETGLRAHYYTSGTIFDAAPSEYFYLFMGAALLFAVYKGTEPTLRAALIVAGLFAAFMLVITLALIPDIDTDRLYPALIDDPESLPAQVLRETSRNCEPAVFAVLCGGSRKPGKLVIPAYIGISCAVTLLMTFLGTTVFGELVSRLDLPFYSLSSTADITVMHRINGIDVMLWVMAAIIRLALLSLAFREVAAACFVRGMGAAAAPLIFAAAGVGLAELFTAFPALSEPLRRLSGTCLPLFAVTVLIPPLTLIGKRRKKA